MTEYPFYYDMPSVRISDSEIAIQRACRDMVPVLFRHARLAAVPNGTYIRSFAGRAKAKKEGLSKGFPDLVIVGKIERLYPAPLVAFCEIKADTPLSDEQRDWLTFMADCGHHCGVFRSTLTLEAKLREWGFS